MQTILGAGGAIGTELVKEFARTGQSVRLVSRNPNRPRGRLKLSPRTSPIWIKRYGRCPARASCTCWWA